MDVEWRATLAHFFFWFFGFFARSLGAHQFILFASLVCWCCVHVRTRPGRRNSSEKINIATAYEIGAAPRFFSSIIPSPATTKQARTCATSSSESDATPSSVHVYKPSGNWLHCIGREGINTTTTILRHPCTCIQRWKIEAIYRSLSAALFFFALRLVERWQATPTIRPNQIRE